jgi:dihydroneopterin triphosphate diphosphatase
MELNVDGKVTVRGGHDNPGYIAVMSQSIVMTNTSAAITYKIAQSVLVVIHDTSQRVLLIERAQQPDFWQSVTGSKDSVDENWRQVALREVFEETGILVGAGAIADSALQDWHIENEYEIYPLWRHRYAPGVTRNTEHVFGLQVPVQTPVLLSPREHVQYCWLPYKDAADKCFSPSNAEAILQLPHFFVAS